MVVFVEQFLKIEKEDIKDIEEIKRGYPGVQLHFTRFEFPALFKTEEFSISRSAQFAHLRC